MQAGDEALGDGESEATPTMWVGGQGEKVTLRIVAERADGWDMDMLPLDVYQLGKRSVGRFDPIGSQIEPVRAYLFARFSG